MHTQEQHYSISRTFEEHEDKTNKANLAKQTKQKEEESNQHKCKLLNQNSFSKINTTKLGAHRGDGVHQDQKGMTTYLHWTKLIHMINSK
jgi:hypothetical protein